MTKCLILIAHGSTAATRKSAFPADEPLEASSRSMIVPGMGAWWRGATATVSPRTAAVETAAGLYLEASVESELSDIDHGRWSGRTIAEVAASEAPLVERWLGDAAFDCHGGESRLALQGRMERWLARCAAEAGHGVAVTHAAVIRAVILVVLEADPEAFWRLDIGPLTATELRHDGRRWVLRSSGCALRAGGTPPSKAR